MESRIETAMSTPRQELPRWVFGETEMTKAPRPQDDVDYSQSVWSTAANSQPARVNDTQGGKYFMDCVQSIVASPTAKAAKYVSLVTWNDYDERTAVEDMIVGITGVRIGN